VLFFSGGTALNQPSRVLTEYTHNSIHLVTPFDSGGSSAILRDAFDMPSIGDMRSRLMALADQSLGGNPEVYELFSHRLDRHAEHATLLATLQQMVSGQHPLVAAVRDPMRKIIRSHLRFFREAMPDDFDLHGASIGNLILAGGYLNQGRHLDPVVFMFSKLAAARGTVRTITGESRHLMASLADGTMVRGQRNLTGKETEPVHSPVERVWLTDDLDSNEEKTLPLRQKVADLIARADLICFPIGSFYSSVIANLLPDGVAAAIAANGCPKVYVPNMGRDPEQLNMTVADSTRVLLQYLRGDTEGLTDYAESLDFVVVDSACGTYDYGLDRAAIEDLGPTVIDTALVSDESRPWIDGRLLVEVLLSMT
jgi:CofD-related protein of GAK system